jgi:DNA-binding SARP family transcriptional activator
MEPRQSALVSSPSAALGLLHGFELRRGDARITLAHSAQRLIALLALRRRPVRRDWAAGALWLESSQEHANGCLRTTLWRADPAARQLVLATPTELALDEALTVDTDEMTAAAQRVFERDGGRRELRTLQEAGELLPDWYDDWVVLERERLRQLRLHALETLCVDFTARGRYAEAVEAGLAAVMGEPLRESAQRSLIGAYVAEGNPSDALRQYQLFRDRLRRDLALAPSPSLQRLVASIVTLA